VRQNHGPPSYKFCAEKPRATALVRRPDRQFPSRLPHLQLRFNIAYAHRPSALHFKHIHDSGLVRSSETPTGYQLKIIQECITLTVFAIFAWLYLGERIRWNYAASFLFLVGAVVAAFWGKL